ncbi:hypothetical protein K438DRAFT_2024235 [Mycena galopus ATCC 62051]|nr:hypothetical protein K438DRAFT_2024235 [Mycena galopus ATCC 62051]
MQGPAISIASPTPPRPAAGFRLLYRGALSLPDSHLLLDGLTFTARLDHSGSGNRLLESPLALALETMRKRPTLRFIATTNLADTYLDETGGISLDIHPNATLTRIYFENTFCLDPSASFQSGIKVALGDNDGPETTQMLIFARPQPQSSELQLPSRASPPPRPRGHSSASRARTTPPRGAPQSASTAREHQQQPVCRAEAHPECRESRQWRAVRTARRQERATTTQPADEDEDDVFGNIPTAVENKASGSAAPTNRTWRIIKQSTIHLLPISKSHPEYKDIYTPCIAASDLHCAASSKSRRWT